MAAIAEIRLRVGVAAQQGGDGAAALPAFGTAHALRAWDADLDVLTTDFGNKFGWT